MPKPRSMEAAAFHYLRRFPSSSENLRRVLWRKARRDPDFSSDAESRTGQSIDAAVQKMQDAGLLDDEAYAKALCQSLHMRGKPARAIQQKLREKGIDAELIRETLSRLAEDRDVHPDVEAAWALARRKRIGPYREDAALRKEHLRKDLAVFARAGFSYARAKEVLDSSEAPRF